MHIETCRDDVLVHPLPLGGIVLTCPLVKEFATRSQRVTPPSGRTEIILRPGDVYVGFTGLRLPAEGEPHLSLSCRATPESWAEAGLTVLRVDRGDAQELLVYFSVYKECQFSRHTPFLEIRSGSGKAATPLQTAPGDAKLLPPGHPAVQENRHVQGAPRAIAAGAAAPVADSAAAEAAVKAWLDEPDERGRIVEGPDVPGDRELRKDLAGPATGGHGLPQVDPEIEVEEVTGEAAPMAFMTGRGDGTYQPVDMRLGNTEDKPGTWDL